MLLPPPPDLQPPPGLLVLLLLSFAAPPRRSFRLAHIRDRLSRSEEYFGRDLDLSSRRRAKSARVTYGIVVGASSWATAMMMVVYIVVVVSIAAEMTSVGHDGEHRTDRAEEGSVASPPPQSPFQK